MSRRGNLMNEGKIFRVYLSAGHGYYYNSSWSQWMTQRRSYWGVIEDFWNVLVARELFVLVDEDPRFNVFMNRDFFNEEIGISGHQKWMEASHIFFKEIGAPEYVWNNGIGIQQAINADALGAKYHQTDIAISIHANSGGGEARGHEVWHHTQSNLGGNLAHKINEKLDNMPNLSRGVKADSYHDQFAFWKTTQGQIMSLIEYFFFDNEEDNELMKLQKNIVLSAQLTYQGLVDFIETYGRTMTWVS